MDNGALVFIIIFEAIVIIWLASKLKHYQKFEHLLAKSNQPAGADRSAGTSHAATQVSGVSSSTRSADSSSAIRGEESDVNIEEAKRVQRVMARCRYAEFYLEQLDDDYERGQFEHIVESCMITARGINDIFFRSSALHPIILLLDRAGWEDSRDSLLAEVEDEILHERISAELVELSEQSD